MSIEALNYILKTKIERSSDKLVMLVLANYADENGICFPSQARIEYNTSLDRKSIIASLQRMIEDGHLADTGFRRGETRQIVVYQILGVPENCQSHYVYKSYDPVTGEYYIGCRSYNGDPNTDVYRGSGAWIKICRKAGTLLLKEVLFVFKTRAEAIVKEMEVHRQVDGDPLCKNEGLPSLAKARGQAQAEEFRKHYPPKKQSQIRESLFGDENIPNFPVKGPVFPGKESQKRDIEPPENHQRTTIGKSTRGSRITSNWEPSAEDMQFAACLGLDNLRVLARFVDFWLSKPGKDGVKLDWSATWRNWCRSASERGQDMASRSNGGPKMHGGSL